MLEVASTFGGYAFRFLWCYYPVSSLLRSRCAWNNKTPLWMKPFQSPSSTDEPPPSFNVLYHPPSIHSRSLVINLKRTRDYTFVLPTPSQHTGGILDTLPGSVHFSFHYFHYRIILIFKNSIFCIKSGKKPIFDECSTQAWKDQLSEEVGQKLVLRIIFKILFLENVLCCSCMKETMFVRNKNTNSEFIWLYF